MKLSITDFFSKCDQIRSFQRIWSHLLKKSVIENFVFSVVYYVLTVGFEDCVAIQFKLLPSWLLAAHSQQ